MIIAIISDYKIIIISQVMSILKPEFFEYALNSLLRSRGSNVQCLQSIRIFIIETFDVN